MPTTRIVLAGLVGLFLGTTVPTSFASDATDPHAAHKRAMSNPEVSIQQVAYQIPDMVLLDSSGAETNLRELLAGDEPVIVNFIFTTCTTICPVITATTLQLQRRLEGAPVQPRFVSISIDPDYDSADVLRGYAQTYGADWTFLTGSLENVVRIQQVFDAYRGNKVNHFALTLMHVPNRAEWTRVEGLTSAEQLASIWLETAG